MEFFSLAGYGRQWNSSNQKGPSTDYIGLQVGAKLIFKVIENPGDIISADTHGIFEIDTSETYKTKYLSTAKPENMGEHLFEKEQMEYIRNR